MSELGELADTDFFELMVTRFTPEPSAEECQIETVQELDERDLRAERLHALDVEADGEAAGRARLAKVRGGLPEQVTVRVRPDEMADAGRRAHHAIERYEAVADVHGHGVDAGGAIPGELRQELVDVLERQPQRAVPQHAADQMGLDVPGGGGQRPDRGVVEEEAEGARGHGSIVRRSGQAVCYFGATLM